MSEEKQNKRELFNRLPGEWPADLFPTIQERVRQANRKVIVLDDDPTGTQTVHGVSVLTEWPISALEYELLSSDPAFYLLTNSRSLHYDQAHALNTEIGLGIRQAGQRTGRDFVVISRGDSTLRGHFPGEVAALALGLQTDFDAWILAPFFPEGGRYTVDDIHYVAEGDWLVPAGQAEEVLIEMLWKKPGEDAELK